VAAVRRNGNEIAKLEWAACQDLMVEPKMLAGTGLSLREPATPHRA
jgi:hypothetical protein